MGALSRGNYRLRPRPNLGVVVVSTELLRVRSELPSPQGSHRVGNLGSPSLFPHQRSERHRTSRTSTTSSPEPFSCTGIAPLGKSTRGVGFGGISCSQMPLRPVSPGCSGPRSAPAARNVDLGRNQTPLYSRIDTEGVIFYNWQVSAIGQRRR